MARTGSASGFGGGGGGVIVAAADSDCTWVRILY